jgi:cytochrome P450
VSTVLETYEDFNDDKRDVLKDTAGSFYAAGTDTTVAAVEILVFALLMHPEVQSKVHEEIDRVVGRDRLPSFEDEPHLPYLYAVIMEAFRWRPVVPLGVPHKAMQDDIYEGYFIPAGASVFGNAWAMLHDERDFPNPTKFVPERFMKDGKLNPDVQNPLEIGFGFGRRVCSGRDIALTTEWLMVASLLSVFEITKPLDVDGQPITPKLEFIPGPVTHPAPFKCLLKARHEGAEALIRSTTESIA